MATVEKRPLTPDEIADAERLAAAWREYKRTHTGASQEWLGTVTGIGGQAVISQYMRGIIPLNVKALLAICAQINVAPASISPTLARHISSPTSDIDLSGVSPEARNAIEAIVRADRAGESPETFKLVLRLFPQPDEDRVSGD
ncbi:hypothetical protein [Burkholderia gladioli]|uniref:hypothetical protein n=1 Tax=Burkholderia gladioli TaxID=28095 RepID=UPI00164193B1|nr:hypothetical protein [Burkholderia gladioli]